MGIFNRRSGGSPPDRAYDPHRLGVRPEVHEAAAAAFRQTAMAPGINLTSAADDFMHTAQLHENIAASLRGARTPGGGNYAGD